MDNFFLNGERGAQSQMRDGRVCGEALRTAGVGVRG